MDKIDLEAKNSASHHTQIEHAKIKSILKP